jgi:hypothetical protein
VVAHYRNGADDVRGQGLRDGAVWAWNRTQASWCMHNQPNQRGDSDKFYPGRNDRTKFTVLSLGRSTTGICW